MTGQTATPVTGADLVKRRLLSGGAWALGGRVVSSVAAVATNALLARILTPQEFGAYFLAFSVVSIGATIGALGLDQAVVRFVAESMGKNQPERARRFVLAVLGIGTLGAIVVAAAYFLFGNVIAEKVFHAPTLAAVGGLTAGWIAVATCQNLIGQTFRGFHDIRFASVFGGAATGVLLSISLTILWIFERHGSLAEVILLAAASGAASTMFAFLMLRRKISVLPRYRKAGTSELYELLSVNWPLLVTNLTIFLVTQADVWIVGTYLPQKEVALYASAVRLVVLVTMPWQIVNLVVPPMISELYARGRKHELERILRSTATIAGIPSFVVLTLFILFGSHILGLVFGDYYRAAAVVLMLLGLGRLFDVWVGSCGQALLMTGYQNQMMLITILGGAIVVFGGVFLANHFGIEGVASASTIGIGLSNLIMLLFSKKYIGIWTHVRIPRHRDWHRVAEVWRGRSEK